MISIVHGDDTQKSFTHLISLTDKLSNVVRFEGKSLTGHEIDLAFQSTGLFENESSIVIHNFSKLPKDAMTKLIEKANSSKDQIFIWDDKKIDARAIKKFKNPQVFEFQLPKYYFEYLDALKPRNSRPAVRSLQNLSKQLSGEQIFYSSIKRVRQLLMAKHGSQNFEELSKMSPWQLSKLEGQARVWEETKLRKFYTKLFELEVSLKSSNLPLNLVKHIDILLLNELQ